ncbi:MAG TPA: ABC transporter permease [Vicinamibacterales bacterium]|nr:ABC transporter permease [Vicinamibacterales bacterium]
MQWLRFFRRARWDDERAREMRAHIDHLVDDLLARGLSPDEARRQAHRQFGNPTLLREEIYTMNTVPLLETLLRDARYAARILRRSPGFTLTAVLTLALAIGVNVAVFTVVDGVLLRPLPYPAPERLALVQTTFTAEGAPRQMTAQHGVAWEVVRDHATSVDAAVFSTWTSGVNVVDGSRASFAEQQRVGAGYFAVLGVAPALGREFTGEEDHRGGPPAVILSDAYWRTALGADPRVVGRTIRLRGEPHVIVGVMPRGLRTGVAADLWTPLRASTTGEGEGENYSILLRLRDGATWTQAEAELERLGAEILRRRPRGDDVQARVGVVPLQRGLTAEVRPMLLVIWGAVALVLIVACVNLAGLLLARGARRARELATRLALGSGRVAVVRQLFVESAVLAVAGGVLGLIVAAGVLVAGHSFLEPLTWQPLALGWRGAAAAGALAAGSALAIGLMPSLQGVRLDVARGLVSAGARAVAGSRSHWSRRLLVVSQAALGVVLLVAAALLVRTFLHLRGLEPGFTADGVTTATVSLQDARYRTAADVTRLVDTTLARLETSGGIASSAVSLGLPYERLLNLGFAYLDGPEAADQRRAMTSATYIAGEYFRTLGIPVRAGRAFTPRDTAAAPLVAVVNEAFARQYFAGNRAVGRRIGLAGGEREIVGVVGNVQVRPGFGDRGPLAPMPLVYLPLAQTNDAFLRLVHGWFNPSFIVRTDAAASAAVPAIRAALDASDPLLPFAKVRSLDEVRAAAVAQPRMLMTLLVALASTTVLLALVGLYGLVASTVSERTREMGIRLALGARPAQAVRTLALPGVTLAIAGTLLGLVAARGAVTALQSFVWGVRPTDPLTFASVGALFVVTATVASLLPALYVLRLDPARTLRQE